MLISFIIAGALAGNPYAGRSADVEASGSVGAPPQAVFDVLTSTRNLPAVFDAECTDSWDVDTSKDGLGARFKVRYKAASMKRKLKGMVSKAEGGRNDGKFIVELDHDGAKGFITRFTIAPADEGSEVVMTTYLNQPPWPFRKVFFESIQPAWVTCQQQAITNLDALVLKR